MEGLQSGPGSIDTARGKTHNNRGRKSKYSDIYLAIERMQTGETFIIPKDVPEEFFVFLPGAMRRRNIKYVLKEQDGEKTIVKQQ